MLLHFFEQLSLSINRYWEKYSKPSIWPLPISEDQETTHYGSSDKQYSLKDFILVLGLKWYPLVVFFVFILSNFWDFTTQQIKLFNISYSLEHLLRILSVSGLIGYATNWLAITMLFKPVHKRPIFGQGLIPRQKNKIAERLAKTISSELLHPDLISEYVHRSAFIQHYKNLWVLRTKNILSDEGFRIEIQQIILELIIRIINEDEFRFNIASSIEAEVNNKLQNRTFDRIALKTYTILKGANVQELVNEALIELPDELKLQIEQVNNFFDKLPSIIDEHVDTIEHEIITWLHGLISRLNIYQFIIYHLKKYDESRIETLIRTSTNEGLVYIKRLGAVIGTVGGLMIWKPIICLISTSTVLLSLYILDLFIHKTKY